MITDADAPFQRLPSIPRFVKILLESWEFFFKNAVQLVVLRW